VYRPSPDRLFPFKHYVEGLPSSQPDHHLDHTAIPRIPDVQSRGFPRRPYLFLASFAELISNGNSAAMLAWHRSTWSIIPQTPLKAGYTAHSSLLRNRIAGSSRIVVKVCIRKWSNLSSTKLGSPR